MEESEIRKDAQPIENEAVRYMGLGIAYFIFGLAKTVLGESKHPYHGG
jgi:hypothetical protein